MENIHNEPTIQAESQTNQCINLDEKKINSRQEPQILSNKDQLSVTVIENKDTLKEIPTGKPTYFETQSKKEIKSLKLFYGILSLFIVGFILARILPQFLYDGCRISAGVWIISISLYISNLIFFNLLISNKMLFTITAWIIINCLTFLTDLIATLLAFQAPLYYNQCKSQDQMDSKNECQQKQDLKNVLQTLSYISSSIINVLFLLIIGITHGCYCYKGYQI